MTDDADLVDSSQDGKHSKRALLKDALARTKSKFMKDDKDKQFTLSDDVNDFLAAGRHSTHDDDRLPIAPSLNSSTSDLLQQQQQSSPRGASIPRLDVSQTTRFPNARPVGVQEAQGGHELLVPDSHQRERSHSFNSFKKKRSRPRNLSVSFDDRPPVIIGMGGDESEQPTVEISRLRQTQSLCPMPQQRPGSSHSHSSQGSTSSLRRKPVPQYANPFADDESLPIRRLQRVPTGNEMIKSLADHEYELSLGKGTVKNDSSATPGLFKTSLVSPKPIHPPVAPPQVRSPPMAPPYSPPNYTSGRDHPDTLLKQGSVQVTVTDADLMDRQPKLPTMPGPIESHSVGRGPNVVPIMPHQTLHHRQKPSLNETETMNQGTDGWL